MTSCTMGGRVRAPQVEEYCVIPQDYRESAALHEECANEARLVGG
jgi:hypothetical protein